jgi:hypothetical protein
MQRPLNATNNRIATRLLAPRRDAAQLNAITI